VSTTAIHISPTELAYSGRELRSHFAFDAFGVLGDSIVAFVGPCRVELDALVDLEDVRRREPIFSPRMLHVIAEHFDAPLREMVLRQRLLARLAADLLRERSTAEPLVRGDDLFVAGRKASVSIATRSPVSALLHFGVNVKTEGTPLPTFGLAEAGVEPEPFAHELLRRYAAEMDDIQRATAKVRGVP